MICVIAMLFAFACVIGQAATSAEPADWKSALSEGSSLRLAGHYQDALVVFRRGLEMLEHSHPDPFSLASGLNSLAVCYEELGRASEADHYYRRALDVVEKEAGVHSVSRAQILVNMAASYTHRNQFSKAETILREALSIYSDLVPPQSSALAIARGALGATLLRLDRVDEADLLIHQALNVLERDDSQKDGSYGLTLNSLGAIRWTQGRTEEAILIFQQSIANLEDNVGKDCPVILHPLSNLAFSLLNRGRLSLASENFSKALHVAENSVGTNNKLYGQLLIAYSGCLKKSGRKGEAKRLQSRATGILKDAAAGTGVGMTVDISALRAK